jgi:hypothetical protein
VAKGIEMNLKPYQLVLVNMGEYQYVGETMGFPLPSHAIMVRKVPSMPATLVELPTSSLVKVLDPKLRRYLHMADIKNVDGIMVFPIDMLRRECASPVNFNPETCAVDLSMGEDAPMMVAKLTTQRDPQWNLERWKSFGWELEHRLTERFIQV